MDWVVEEAVLVEINVVEALTRLHEAQITTDLKLSVRPVARLMNFNVTPFKHRIKRFVR